MRPLREPTPQAWAAADVAARSASVGEYPPMSASLATP